MAKNKRKDPAVTLANLADQHAVLAKDLVNHPRLLKKGGLNPKQITSTVVSRADRLNREALSTLIEKRGANLPDTEPNEYINVNSNSSQEKKPMKADRTKLIALFTELKYPTADKWSDTRLKAKVNKLSTLVDPEKVEISDENRELLTSLLEADEVEIEGGAEKKPAKKRSSKKGAATTTVTVKESPAPAAKKRGSKKKTPAKKSTPAKGKRSAKKKASSSNGRDAFGSTIGSQCAQINATMGKRPKEVAAIAKETKLSNARVSSHMRWLINRDFVEKVEGKGYKLISK